MAIEKARARRYDRAARWRKLPRSNRWKGMARREGRGATESVVRKEYAEREGGVGWRSRGVSWSGSEWQAGTSTPAPPTPSNVPFRLLASLPHAHATSPPDPVEAAALRPGGGRSDGAEGKWGNKFRYEPTTTHSALNYGDKTTKTERRERVVW
jgi:hypothetical protein